MNIERLEQKVNSYKTPVYLHNVPKNYTYADIFKKIFLYNEESIYINKLGYRRTQCQSKRRRSDIDFCRIMKTYFPEMSVGEHLYILNAMSSDSFSNDGFKMFRLFCTKVGRHTYTYCGYLKTYINMASQYIDEQIPNLLIDIINMKK